MTHWDVYTTTNAPHLLPPGDAGCLLSSGTSPRAFFFSLRRSRNERRRKGRITTDFPSVLLMRLGRTDTPQEESARWERAAAFWEELEGFLTARSLCCQTSLREAKERPGCCFGGGTRSSQPFESQVVIIPNITSWLCVTAACAAKCSTAAFDKQTTEWLCGAASRRATVKMET